jgi:Flp pilus assembly protein TadD
MNCLRHRVSVAGMALTAIVWLQTMPAVSSPSNDPSATAKIVSDESISDIQHALDEQRYVDAGNLLNQTLVGGSQDPRIVLLVGELSLARSNYSDALASFVSVEANSVVRAQALQGEGIALSNLGRSNEARAALQKAVAEDPSLWRAWNALGTEFDRQRDWTRAEAAYDHALSNSDSAAIALNNRGFSLLLQKRLDEASADFVAALQKKPDLASARTNLRLAIAMKGDYDHAVAGGSQDAQAALFNNAGVAAMLHGDYAQADKLFGQAIKAKGEYYARAAANLELTHALAEQGDVAASASHDTVAH